MRPALQPRIEPLVVSWDWREGRTFAARHRYRGTSDPAAYLAVPAAIDFQAAHRWDEVRERCAGLAERARVEIAPLTGVEPFPPQGLQMVSVPLPPCDPRGSSSAASTRSTGSRCPASSTAAGR